MSAELGMTEQLDKLIPMYGTNNQASKEMKETLENQNKQIKSIMESLNLKTHEAGGWKATCSTSERETINEEMMLSILREHDDCGIIKTKEYIDFDALENAIYNGLISKEVLLELDKAKSSKTVVTLKVTKVRKKKGDDD